MPLSGRRHDVSRGWIGPVLEQMVKEQSQENVRWTPYKFASRLGEVINNEGSMGIQASAASAGGLILDVMQDSTALEESVHASPRKTGWMRPDKNGECMRLTLLCSLTQVTMQVAQRGRSVQRQKLSRCNPISPVVSRCSWQKRSPRERICELTDNKHELMIINRGESNDY